MPPPPVVGSVAGVALLADRVLDAEEVRLELAVVALAVVALAEVEPVLLEPDVLDDVDVVAA